MDSGPPEIRQNTQTQTDTHVLTPLMEETNKPASLSLIPRPLVSFPDPWSHSQTLSLILRLSVSFPDTQSHSQDSQSHSQTLGLIPRLILRLSVSFPDTQSIPKTLGLIPRLSVSFPRLSVSFPDSHSLVPITCALAMCGCRSRLSSATSCRV